LLARGEQRAWGDCCVVGGQSHQGEPLELVTEVAPGVLSATLGHSDQQQGQSEDHDVSPDPLLLALVHEAQIEGGLHVPPASLYLQQLLVTPSDLVSGQGGVGNWWRRSGR